MRSRKPDAIRICVRCSVDVKADQNYGGPHSILKFQLRKAQRSPPYVEKESLSLLLESASSYVSSAPGGIVIIAGGLTKCFAICMNCSASGWVSIARVIVP
jgi:hypothetical protein